MLEFANTIYVDRPLAEVFNFLSDFENIPKWNYYVLEVTKISSETTSQTDERKGRVQVVGTR